SRFGRKQPAELNLFAEMQAFSGKVAGLSASTILRMVTANAARALGWSGQLGELSASAVADIIALPFKGRVAEAEEAVLWYKGEVERVMINGQWVKRHAGLPLRER